MQGLANGAFVDINTKLIKTLVTARYSFGSVLNIKKGSGKTVQHHFIGGKVYTRTHTHTLQIQSQIQH